MAFVKKPVAVRLAASSDTGMSRVSASATRDAEIQRKRARTLAKQQQAAERIAAATGQMASGIAEAASAAEELERAANQIATGTEEASPAIIQMTVARNWRSPAARATRPKYRPSRTCWARTRSPWMR